MFLKMYILNIMCAKFGVCITMRNILMEIFTYSVFDEAVILKTGGHLGFSAKTCMFLKMYILNISCAKFDVCIPMRQILMEILTYSLYLTRRPS